MRLFDPFLPLHPLRARGDAGGGVTGLKERIPDSNGTTIKSSPFTDVAALRLESPADFPGTTAADKIDCNRGITIQ